MSGNTAIKELSLLAPAAGPNLLDFLTEVYAASTHLFVDCVQRVTACVSIGQSDRDNVGDMINSNHDLTPVEDLLHAARKEGTSLFVKEKQNLYIDPVQEASRWARAIGSLSPSAVDHEVLAKLNTWAIAGLECLINTAEHETDGPLGWTSKPEVFVLGTRVLIAVRLLLQWRKLGLVQESPDHLSSLLERWKRVDGHPLWTRELLEE